MRILECALWYKRVAGHGLVSDDGSSTAVSLTTRLGLRFVVAPLAVSPSPPSCVDRDLTRSFPTLPQLCLLGALLSYLTTFLRRGRRPQVMVMRQQSLFWRTCRGVRRSCTGSGMAAPPMSRPFSNLRCCPWQQVRPNHRLLPVLSGLRRCAEWPCPPSDLRRSLLLRRSPRGAHRRCSQGSARWGRPRL